MEDSVRSVVGVIGKLGIRITVQGDLSWKWVIILGQQRNFLNNALYLSR